MSPLVLACVLTLLHVTGTYMRVPILPLYATAHGATPADVGLIVGLNMLVAAVCAIPLGRASDRWGRRALLIAGIVASAVTSLALPLVTSTAALALVYGLAGLGLAAFTPSIMSLVGDLAPPGAVAKTFAWYTTALYTAFGVGPIVGGLVADAAGFEAAFVTAGVIVVISLLVAFALPRPPARTVPAPRTGGGFAAVRRNRRVWAGWLATLAGLASWAATQTFFPLLGRERGLSASAIGLVLGAQALANTVARVPAGYVIDRTRARARYVTGGLLLFAAATALLPHARGTAALLALSAAAGVAYAFAFVAVTAMLADASTPATRGFVMGGYSTAIFGGFGLASVALGPVIASGGFALGFAVAAMATVAATVAAAGLAGSGSRAVR